MECNFQQGAPIRGNNCLYLSRCFLDLWFTVYEQTVYRFFFQLKFHMLAIEINHVCFIYLKLFIFLIMLRFSSDPTISHIIWNSNILYRYCYIFHFSSFAKIPNKNHYKINVSSIQISLNFNLTKKPYLSSMFRNIPHWYFEINK